MMIRFVNIVRMRMSAVFTPQTYSQVYEKFSKKPQLATLG